MALFSLLNFWSVTHRFNRDYPDLYGMELHEQRLQPVRDELPADAIVGFVSDLPLDSLDGQTLFFAAQYALAPRVVVTNDSKYQADLILGYYARRVQPEAEAVNLGMKVYRDYGGGVVLYERETAQ